MSLMSVAIGLVALCIVIVVHEFGHYICAVSTGMKVDRFSVFGIGAPIVRLGTWRGTEFVIGAIPFGAYVQIRGMEPEDEDTPAEDREVGFRNKPLAARMLVLLGGPLANYAAAMVLFFGVYVAAGVPGPAIAIEVAGVRSDSAAATAGIMPGDRIVAVGETTIDPEQRGQDLAVATKAAQGTTTTVTVERDGAPQTFEVTLAAEGDAPLGVDLRAVAPREPVSVATAAMRGIADPITTSGAQLRGLYLWATGQLQANMSGPIGMVQALAASVTAGVVAFVSFVALISTMLGLFNLLPLPALDGGRLTFLVYEAVARRRANPRVEELVHGYGMLVLLALLVLVSVGDVRRLLH